MTVISVQRVMDADEAATHKNARVPVREPMDLPTGPVTLIDADTGEAFAFTSFMPEDVAERMAGVIFHYRSNFGGVVRAGGMRSKTAPFGNLGPAAVFKRYGPTSAVWARDDPEGHAIVAGAAATLQEQFVANGPDDAVMRNQAARDKIHADYRLADTCWTSGIVNDTVGLYYHYDRNNTPGTWSGMVVLRAGVSGGHLHIMDYDVTLPCRDRELLFFPGMDLMHGVTPITKTLKNAYRFSAVYYSVKKFVGLRDAQTEINAGKAHRAQLEQDLLERQKKVGYLT